MDAIVFELILQAAASGGYEARLELQLNPNADGDGRRGPVALELPLQQLRKPVRDPDAYGTLERVLLFRYLPLGGGVQPGRKSGLAWLQPSPARLTWKIRGIARSTGQTRSSGWRFVWCTSGRSTIRA